MSSRRFQFLSEAEVLNLPDPQYLIDGIIPEKSFVVLSAAPGSGKTFLILSMLYAIASGTNWLNLKTRSASVLYAYGEGGAGLKARIAVLKLRFDTKMPVRFLVTPPHLNSPSDLLRFINQLRGLESIPQIIVIDTLARAFVGGDENSARDMGLLVNGVSSLISDTGSSVVLLHHTRKGGGEIRGSSALMGAVDVAIQIDGSDIGSQQFIKCLKMKDDEPFPDICFVLQKTILPDGKSSLHPVRDQLFENAGEQSRVKKRATSKDHLKDLLSLIGEAASDGLSHGELKQLFMGGGTGSKSTFDRTLADAKRKNKVRMVNTDTGQKYFLEHSKPNGINQS